MWLLSLDGCTKDYNKKLGATNVLWLFCCVLCQMKNIAWNFFCLLYPPKNVHAWLFSFALTVQLTSILELLKSLSFTTFLTATRGKFSRCKWSSSATEEQQFGFWHWNASRWCEGSVGAQWQYWCSWITKNLWNIVLGCHIMCVCTHEEEWKIKSMFLIWHQEVYRFSN